MKKKSPKDEVKVIVHFEPVEPTHKQMLAEQRVIALIDRWVREEMEIQKATKQATEKEAE